MNCHKIVIQSYRFVSNNLYKTNYQESDNITMFFLRASKSVVEKETQITDWEIVFHGENLDDVEGYLLLSFESKEHEMWGWKHVEILSDDCSQQRYYFQHKWLPDNAWFRLNPVYEKIAQYVKTGPIPEKKMDAAAYLKAFESEVFAACGS